MEDLLELYKNLSLEDKSRFETELIKLKTNSIKTDEPYFSLDYLVKNYMTDIPQYLK